MNKNLLVVAGGILQINVIKKAKELGIKTYVVDQNPQAPGMKLADVPIPVNFVDVDATIDAVSRIEDQIHGVITVSSDLPITSISHITDKLGLPGISIESARLNNNKILMREKFQEYGAPCPGFRRTKSPEEARNAAIELGFPVMVKAIDSSGSRLR